MNSEETIKREAIRQVVENGLLIADVAGEFGISNKQLYRWLREGDKKKPTNNSQNLLANEIEYLRAELSTMSKQIQSLQNELLRHRGLYGGEVIDFRNKTAQDINRCSA